MQMVTFVHVFQKCTQVSSTVLAIVDNVFLHRGEKGSCDHKAASLKAKMKLHLNEGHDIETAEQMVEKVTKCIFL